MHELDLLFLEDDPIDVDLMKNELKKANYNFVSRSVTKKAEFVDALEERKPDIILADYNLPDFTGFDALEIAKQKYPNTPFIIVTGSISEETAAESILKGAWDYVVKERIYRLKSAIESSLKLKKERKEKQQAQQKLEANEKKYRELYNFIRLMADTVPDMIWAKDMEKKYTFANKAICEDLLIAEDTQEPIGKTDLFFAEREREKHADNPEWHTFGELCQNSDDIVMESKKQEEFDEYGNVRGEFLFLEVHKAPIFDENGVMIGTVGSARDVTEQKKAQEQIEQDLKEKEIMLTEIHHRVKNNLQVISSMLRMERRNMQNEVDKKVLNECFTRIKTMSNVHEILYKSENFYDINFSNFIDKIVAELYMLYDMSSQEIEIIKELEDLKLDINHAIPAGMIINELVSNVYKYAIPQDGKCHLNIKFKKEDDEYVIVIADDGIGLPNDLDIEKAETTGLRLVYLLCQQLRGDIAVDREKGTNYTIRFKQGKLSTYSKI